MNEDRLRAAVAAGVMSSDESYRSLLQSIVEVARAIFSAQKSSIFLLDEEADELVFEALAGDEEQGLTVLVVEQNANAALELSSRAYLLEVGRVALSGASVELREHEGVRKSYLGY